jgi:hypothetical protein
LGDRRTPALSSSAWRGRSRAAIPSSSSRPRSPTSRWTPPRSRRWFTAAKQNLRAAGEKRRIRTVVADAGYWSRDNVNLTGVETFIAPGRARQLTTIGETEQYRGEILDRVQAGELDTLEASKHLGVTRARVNQLLRRRRAGEPDRLTTTTIAKIDSPRGRRTYKRGPEHRARIRPDQAQPRYPSHQSARNSPPQTANGS